MSTLINMVRDVHRVEFDKGAIDEWCVYLQRKGANRNAPRDTEYFTRLLQLSATHGSKKIYDDFVRIYTPTNKEINPMVIDMISVIADSYKQDAEEMEIWLTVIYGGMIAEENKSGAVLKKRIKRLGMHQLLLENFSPEAAANFSRGKKFAELDPLMRSKGF